MIDEKQLQEWERLVNDATPGPWYTCDYDLCTQKCPNDDSIHCPHRCEQSMVTSQQDIAFMAASREAMPALIAEVQELQEKLKEETKLFADAMHKNAETHTTNGRLTGFLQGVAYRLGVTDAMKTQDIEKLMREVKEVLDRQEDDLK